MIKEFNYKKWANQELIDSIAQIDSVKYPDKFRLAVRLLNHTYVADQIFKAHLTGNGHSYTWVNTDETPSLTMLKAQIETCDDWYIDYVSTLNDDDRKRDVHFTFTDGEKGTMDVAEICSHILIHGAYHRGNIGMVLADCDVEKPNDIFTRFLHHSESERRK